MKILVIGAHPDDIEEGCAGYLLQRIEAGDKVFHCTITDGSNRGDKQTRLDEQKKADKLLKPYHKYRLKYIDCRTETHLQNLIEDLENIIQMSEPTMILTHYPNDTHHDHRIIAEATLEAGRYVPIILFYESSITRGFEPTHYCDISKEMDKKLKIIQCFESQKDVIGIKGVKALAEYRASQSKQEAKFSESFKAYRDIL